MARFSAVLMSDVSLVVGQDPVDTERQAHGVEVVVRQEGGDLEGGRAVVGVVPKPQGDGGARLHAEPVDALDVHGHLGAIGAHGHNAAVLALVVRQLAAHIRVRLGVVHLSVVRDEVVAAAAGPARYFLTVSFTLRVVCVPSAGSVAGVQGGEGDGSGGSTHDEEEEENARPHLQQTAKTTT